MPIPKQTRRAAPCPRSATKGKSKSRGRALKKASAQRWNEVKPRKGIDSLQANERSMLGEMVMAMPLSEVQQNVAEPQADGGFNVELTTQEIEEFYLEEQKAAVRTSQKQLGEIHRLTIEDDVYRKIGTPVLCLLQQRLQKLLGSSRSKPEEVKTYFSLLLASRRIDLIERKSLGESGKPTERSEEEKMEMVWDMFALPEEERVRRRALWKEHQKQSGSVQGQGGELNKKEAK